MTKQAMGPICALGTRIYSIGNTGHEIVAICVSPRVGGVMRDEENARQIARAVNNHDDLISALNAALADAEYAAERQAIKAGLGVSEWRAFMPKWADDARAVIASATGEAVQ